MLTLWLESLLSEIIISIFYIATIASTWYGGWRSGLVTLIFSALLINYSLIEPRYQFWTSQPKDILHLSIFLLVALIINILVSNFRKSNDKIRQLSQKLARENAEQLRMALSAARMGMWDWDLVSGEIKWSPEHEELFGLVVGSFDGRYETFDAYVHPEDRSLLNQILQQALQSHSNYQCEFRIIWADGSIHWVEGRGHAFYNQAGEPVRMTGTVMAIDERKQAQVLLQQQFEQQRLVMDITQRIRRSLNLQEILQTTVDEVRQFLKCDRVVIIQFFPDSRGAVVVESVANHWKSILAKNICDPCFSEKYLELLQAGLVIAKADINHAAISPCHLEMLRNLQVRANLVVPIANQEELWGLLIAHHCQAPREWQCSEINLLQQLANQVSIAIQQSNIFEQLQTELAERKQIEVALRQSEQRYRSLVNASAQIVWHTDGNGHAINCPENWEDITGQTAAEHLGWGWLEHVHPDERDRTCATWQAAYQNHTLYETEYRLRMKDGNYRDFFVRGVPILDIDGTISEWIGTCTDITKQKQAEVELRQAKEELEIRVAERTAQLRQINSDLQHSESILRSFFDSSVMLMGIVELRENNILHISDNRAAAQFFGTTPEAMQNKFASDLGIPQTIIQEWVRYYHQAQKAQAPLQFEYAHETAIGLKWLSASICPIAISANGYPRFSYIVEDITASKQAKEHIEASLREKEVLLKEIHHRVKNNLAIVSSLLQMQSRRTQDVQANEILRDSHNRIASIALIHETLYSSENLANIDFPQYITQLINHLLDSYNAHSLHIKITTQIEQVNLDIEMAIPCGLIINELVSNALKYAFPERNDGKILVKLSQDKQDLILLIQDNGIGLPEGFDSNKSKKLGINLVKGLVKQLKGSMIINCQQGTEFKIYFQGYNAVLGTESTSIERIKGIDEG
jgi:PAS domain S-box-containing protein